MALTVRNYFSDEDYPRNRVFERGCTCKSWYEEPCDYCQGDYPCPDECGFSAGNCQCDVSDDESDDE